MTLSDWLVFVLTLPGSNAASRMRVWRSLKAIGAGVLRDGVYLLPVSNQAWQHFAEQRQAVGEAGGTAEVFECTSSDSRQEQELRNLFDRAEAYEGWMEKAAVLRDRLAELDEAAARREEAHLRRALGALEAVDYFPGDDRDRARRSVDDLATTINERFSPGEPSVTHEAIRPRAAADYQGRLWATRSKLWVDRVASAWLIQRFIDAEARFQWLENPAQSPPEAIGFDFDGAEFTHVGHRVTFEVLLASFGLDCEPALAKIGAMVRFLDTGGVPVSEATGFVALLGGARRRCTDDNAFLEAAGRMLDDLYTAYSSDHPRPKADQRDASS